MSKATIIAVANSKGGVGKTTTTGCLAEHWHRAGRRVVCFDTDRNQNLSTWLDRAKFGVTCTPLDEEEIVERVLEAATDADVVLIDVAGSLARGLLYAISSANFTLIPCKPDRKDVTEVARTQDTLRSAERMLRRPIPHAALLTEVHRRAEVTKKSRAQLATLEIPVLTADLPSRQAYREMSYTGAPLAYPMIRDDIAAVAAEIDTLTRG
ncbi:AAA family ATPase [Azospirillum brasilense]|uniref:ParA family protein n=1 Tax=Azospirillum argentinense TaxID=2970906 RepID=UPI00190B2647|nr:ParA family protein [Azospirillum argentinense]MBK3798658.1 AAA family ATPase [Azospirillum argentinense]